MSNVVRLATSLTRSPAASPEKSESYPPASIALFCGIGLLVSLVAILLGMPGLWL